MSPSPRIRLTHARALQRRRSEMFMGGTCAGVRSSFLLIAFCLTFAARAATFVWDGGHPGQNAWSLNQNWNPNGAPNNDGTANLLFTGSIRLTPDANSAWSVNSITFDSAAGAFAISGDPVTLQGTAVTDAIANNSTNLQSFSNAWVVGASQTWNANTAALSFSGAIDLAGRTLTLTGSADTAISGAIGTVLSPSGTLVKTGSGTLTLSGVNLYNGGTTVSGGTLQGTTTSLQGNIVNTATVVFDQSTSGTYSGVISGSGAFVKQNSGAVTLGASNTYTGTTSINAGTLVLGAGNALADSTAVSIASGATLQLASGAETVGSIAGAGSIDLGANQLTAGGTNASTTFSGAISGLGGSLAKTGTGTLTLSGANTYSGGTTISSGTLQGTTTSLQGNILNSALMVFDQATNGLYAGVISGEGALTKQNTGTVTLTGANTYAGVTSINAGTLALGAASALSDSTAVTIASGATLQLSAASETIGSLAGAGNVGLGSFTLTAGGTNLTTTFSGVISGTGGLTKTGTGNLTLSSTNTYTGDTTVSTGTLFVGSGGTTGSIAGVAVIGTEATLAFNRSDAVLYAGAISGGGALAQNGASTLTLTGAAVHTGGTSVNSGSIQIGNGGTTGSLAGSATVAGGGSLIFNRADAIVHAGNISGDGALIQNGASTLLLTGTAAHLGGTTVNSGTLQIGNGGTTGSLAGNATLASGATLAFNRSDSMTYSGNTSGAGMFAQNGGSTLTLTGIAAHTGGTNVNAGTLQIGDGGTAGSLAGNAALATNATLAFNRSDPSNFTGNISGNGAITIAGGGTLTLSGVNTYGGGTTVNSGTLQGSTTSLQGNIVNNGGVVFNQASDGIYSGTLSGMGTLTKQNTGMLTLTGTNNNYSGATIVSAGTLALGADNAFSAASNLTLNSSATVALNGFSAQVGTLTYNTSILDFGAANVANTFLFTNGGASTGTLTINNFSTSSDIFAFQQNAPGVDSAFLSGIYFYGLGAGLVGGTQTINGYNGLWTLITPNTASFKTWNSGGINSNWSTGANWDDNGALTAGDNTLRIAFGSGDKFAPVMNNDVTINALRFNSGAGGFTLGGETGKTLTLAGIVPSIIQLSASAQTMSMDVSLSGTTVVETTGDGLLTLSGVVSGSGGINKVGDKTLVLSGANTYTGATTINSGTVILENSAALGSTAAGTTVNSGATLQLQNSINVGAEALTLNGTLLNFSDANSYAGAISGSGAITIAGGSLSLGGSGANTNTGVTTVNSGTLTLAKTGGATAIAGNISIGAGTVQLSGSEQIANTSAVSLTSASAIFNVGSHTETIGSLAGASGSVQIGSAGSLLTGGDNSSTTFAGVISGAGALTKQGSGIFTLSGANTHTGATTVSAGTVLLQNSAALGSTAGGTSVSSGATLQLENNIGVGTEALTLNGILRNASGANSYAGGISGSGSITVDGGSLSLGDSTANTNTGITTVNSGTLTLAKTGGATAIAGNLSIGAGTVQSSGSEQIANTSAVSLTSASSVFNVGTNTETIGSLAGTSSTGSVQIGTGGALFTGGNNASTTFAGVISGGGSLTKQGTGTFTLSGVNSYSGGTAVSAGVLQGTTASLQGNITNSAAVVFAQTTTGAYAGIMSGAGSLTKQNTGTLVLSGANSYSGGTTVSAGTLQGTAVSLQGNIANNASVIFDQAAAGTYAGVMSGTGSLTKQNTGTLTLAGANTYSGGTTVSAGILQGTTTGLQGNITNNAAVVFDQSASGVYAGAMSGTGSLTKQNSGTVILSGTNTYSGGTTVSGGALQGTTSSLQGNITNNAALVFDQTTTGTHAGVISGSGSLTKQNSGTVTLSGANTFTGGTTISGGTLAIGTSNVLADTGSLTLGYGTTFALGGTNSERVGTFSFDNATLNFGTAGTANYFLIGAAGSNTGTLTISNWTSGSDVFGVATGIVSQSFLDNLFFANLNVGIGAVISATAVPVGTYGNYFTVSPIPTFIWDGGQSTGPAADLDNWSKANNWSGNIAPAVGAIKAIVMAGTVQTTNDMDGAFQINSLLFRSDAGAFTINSSTADTLTIGGGGINNQSTSTQTLNVSVALSASQTWTAASGNLVLNGATLLNNANTLTVTGDFNTTIASVMGAGSGGIVKNGAGLLTLSGLNTFTGGVTLNAGVASVGTDGNLGATSGGLTFNGGTLRTSAGITSARATTLSSGGGTFNSNGFDSTLSGVISGAGAFTKSGTGTLTLTGTNTYSGGTTVSAGTLQGNTASLQGNIANSATVAFDQATTGTYAGVISGSGAVTKLNTGTLVLTGANTYTGGTTVSGGTLQGSTTSLQGNIANNAALVFDQTANGTYAGVLSGTGTLTKQNTGSVTLTGAGTYSGATTVTAGTLVLQNSAALGTTAGGTTVSNGATLQLENNISVGAEELALSGTLRSTSGTNSYSGAISGTGAVTVEAGTLTLAGTSANTYSGATTVNAGTLDLNKTAGQNAVGGALTIGNGSGAATVRLLASNQMSDSAAVTLAAGGTPTLNLNGNADTVGSIASSNTAAAIQLGSGGSLAAGADNSSTMFAGIISGAGAFTKDGTGTLTLTGANTYSSGTTVSAGTLRGNTTSLQGSIANSANVTFDQTSSGTYAGAMSGTGSLTKVGASVLTLTGSNTFTGDTQISAGTLRLGASNTLASTAALTISSGATFDVNGFTQTIGALAGPGTVALGVGNLSVGNGNVSSSFAGNITGTGVMNKIGTGTLAFTSSFTFGGELKLTGGTIDISGINLTVGTLRISGNTVLDFGNSVASVLTATNVIIENGAILTINNWVNVQDYFFATGAFYGYNTTTFATTPAGFDIRGVAPQTQIVFTGYAGSSTVWLPYDHQITPAPEPATYGAIFMGASLGFLGWRRWRKKGQQAAPAA